MQNLILTTCFGEFQDIGDFTIPIMQKYARNTSSDFIVLSCRKLSEGDSWNDTIWEKYRVYDFLDIYDRILFLDVDCLINLNSPNIFKSLNKLDTLYIACYDDDDGFQINSGVTLVSKIHKDLFKKPTIEQAMKVCDAYQGTQSVAERWLNLKIRSNGYKINNLWEPFDSWHNRKPIGNFCIYHAQGRNKLKILKERLSKIIKI